MNTWPFPHPTMLAPMEGVTHPAFRRFMADRGGVGVVCTEFVRVTDQPLPEIYFSREVIRCSAPLSVQVMGNDPELMAQGAAWVEKAGADVVDINLGCPTKRAASKGVGAAMLKDLDLLSRVLGAMRGAVSGIMSAKIRAGFDNAEDALGIARTVEAAGADFIAVHPRRRSDQYRGVADWRIIRLLADELSIPVVGNGDCWYASDALRMIEETGCVAVMLGRPALRNPWIFTQIDDLLNDRTPHAPDGVEVAALIHDIVERYTEAFGPNGVIGKLKELVRYVGRAVADDGAFRMAALRAPDVAGVLAEVDQRLPHLPANALDLDAWGAHRFERSGGVASPQDSTAFDAPRLATG